MSTRLEIASFGYHEVTDDPKACGFQRPGALPYKHTEQAFQRDLDHVARSAHPPELVVQTTSGSGAPSPRSAAAVLRATVEGW